MNTLSGWLRSACAQLVGRPIERMRSIGLPTKYKSGTNPLPWTQRWIAGSEVQVAPQETEISSYIVGGVKKDATSETFQGFSL